MKVLVALNEMADKGNWNLFKKKITGIFTSLDDIDTKALAITFGTTKASVEVNSVKDYDLVIAKEDIDGINIGPGTIKKYFIANPKLKLILIVDKKKRGAGKLNALYEQGYYDALLSDDFTIDSLKRLILNNRTKTEAYDYYGLMLYADFSKEKIVSEDKIILNEGNSTERKKELEEKSPVVEGAERITSKFRKKSKKSETASKVDDKAPKTAQKSKKKEKKETEESTGLSQDKNNIQGDNSVEQKSDYDELGDTAVSVEISYALRKEDIREVKYSDNVTVEEVSVDEGELLVEEEEEKEFDASEYLIPIVKDSDFIAPPEIGIDTDESEIKRYIEAVSKQAYNPVKLEVNLGLEDEILEELLEYYTEIDTHWLAGLESGVLTKERFSQHLMQRIDTMYGHLSDEDKAFIYQRFAMFMWGYDVITPLIEDPSISDIALVDYDNIQVKRYGERYFSTITFRSKKHFKNFVQHIIRHNNVDLNDKKPDKTFMDTETSDAARLRFVYSMEYINANREPSLVIRKVLKKKYALKELVEERGMMDYRTAAIILKAVREGCSILWAGTMASGKTTQMNTYLDYIPHNKRGLVMQENEELFSKTHPLLTFQNIRPAEDGKTMYDLRYLATFGLLMDLNYFVIGEIKGREAEQFVEALSTNTISWGSTHSKSAREALSRVARLAVTEHFTLEEQLRKLATGIDMVVYLEKFSVKEIVKVKGWDEEKSAPIFESVDISIPLKKKPKLAV